MPDTDIRGPQVVTVTPATLTLNDLTTHPAVQLGLGSALTLLSIRQAAELADRIQAVIAPVDQVRRSRRLEHGRHDRGGEVC